MSRTVQKLCAAVSSGTALAIRREALNPFLESTLGVRWIFSVCRRWRAKRYMSHSHLSAAVGVKACAACASCAKNASRTSAPTSNAVGPIAGPSQAMSCSPGVCIAATLASITPSASPRQPACTAQTTLALSSHSSTGRQSAVSTAQTTPRWRVKLASASTPDCTCAASTHRVPCTCVSHGGSAGRFCRNRARLAATAVTSSPTCEARLKPAHGPVPTPPWRVVTSAWTPAGAGQSGVIRSLMVDFSTQCLQ